MDKRIWIIGAGGIAIEYAKVLKALGKEFIVIGRGEDSGRKFKEATGIEPILGGLDNILRVHRIFLSMLLIASVLLNLEKLMSNWLVMA